MSHLNFFINFYCVEYIKDVVTHDNNKYLNSDMNLSEYIRVIFCRLIMYCYVDHSVWDFFLKDPINP